MARRIGGVAPAGLVIAAAGIILLVVLFDLSSVASIGSAVALGIFALVTIGHLRIRRDTGANLSLLLLGLVTTGITLLTFVFTTLINEPGSIVDAGGDRPPQPRDRRLVGRVRAGRAAASPGRPPSQRLGGHVDPASMRRAASHRLAASASPSAPSARRGSRSSRQRGALGLGDHRRSGRARLRDVDARRRRARRTAAMGMTISRASGARFSIRVRMSVMSVHLRHPR